MKKSRKRRVRRNQRDIKKMTAFVVTIETFPGDWGNGPGNPAIKRETVIVPEVPRDWEEAVAVNCPKKPAWRRVVAVRAATKAEQRRAR